MNKIYNTNKQTNKNTKYSIKSFYTNHTLSVLYLSFFFISFLLYGITYTFDWALDDNFIYDIIYNIKTNWNGFSTVLSQRFGQDYRPIVVISFYLQHFICGDLTPGISHLINVFLFVILLIQINRFIMLGKYYSDKTQLFAFAILVTFIFMLHPMHTNVVANIKSRDNILSMLFGISGAIQSIKYFNIARKIHLALFLFFMGMALLAKPDAYVFLIFPIGYYFLYENSNLKKKLLVIFFSLFSFFIINIAKYYMIKELVKNKFALGSVRVDSPLIYNDSFLNKVSLSITTMFYYLKFFLIPCDYYAYYGINQIQLKPLFSLINIITFIVYVFIFIFSIIKYKKNKIYLFSFLFFLLSIAYASNLKIIVSGIVADRYNFIGSLGQTMFFSAVLVEYLNIIDVKNLFSKWLFVLMIILFAFSIHRIMVWKDTRTLLLDDIKYNTQSAQAYLMISSNYLNAALFDNLKKDSADEAIKYASFYVNRGLTIDSFNPYLLENKGIVKLYYGNNEQAIFYFRKGYLSDSSMLSCINYIGVSYRNLNNIDTALYYFGKAMNKTNEFTYAANNYIEMLIRKKQFKSVDSTINILINKCPNDKYLKSKVKYLIETGGWYAF